ncbi:MAG: fumarylacetoacetate hydrolase family protein [Cuniculiplasma sp.]
MKIGRVQHDNKNYDVLFINGKPYDLSRILNDANISPFDLTKDIVQENMHRLIEIGGDFNFLVPLDRVNQIRDFYAFEEHARNSRKNRGLEMVPQWYEVPVYYYTNKDALLAHMEKMHKPSFTNQLDLEVEVGIVIGKDGRNIKQEDAISYIYGLTLMNDWSARDVWKRESLLNLGPSKSKDFATSIGPYITTVDEILKLWNGKSFNIELESYINNRLFSRSNMKDIYWGMGQIVEYCSQDVTLKRGDILMTGTFPGGCIFERNDPKLGWLKQGDVIEIRSEVLGSLKNEVN